VLTAADAVMLEIVAVLLHDFRANRAVFSDGA